MRPRDSSLVAIANHTRSRDLVPNHHHRTPAQPMEHTPMPKQRLLYEKARGKIPVHEEEEGVGLDRDSDVHSQPDQVRGASLDGGIKSEFVLMDF